MNIKEIKEVIQLMNENGLSEIELEKEGLKIRLKKGPSGAIEPVIVREVASAPQPQARTVAQEAPVKAAAPAAERRAVRSPMVGTYYASPAPDAAPYVQVGATIDVGQVVCIIEAMKLMNEIKSEVRGKVVEIAVNNGDPVEFGQVLFYLE
ncbi:MAG: Biotin carboxyl carrier protein of acetyl-CoA carboxylase [Candidatus Omnitrophica bacterium]|nr:Biotin carboxyl carrier protein of acetyl-CoA carboxylase [Candidatus Omnitrophota bacterium]